MKHKRQFLVYVLLTALCVALVPVAALAQDGGPGPQTGFGCTFTAAGGLTQTLCSTRNDCTDLQNAQGQPACGSAPCVLLTQCSEPQPAPSSTPIPSIPINTGLPIPDAVPISGPQGQGPVGLVANFYSFAFAIAGFLAFVMIVYGGVRYAFSAGNHSAQSDAKDAIKQALLGLALLLVAFFILRTINPDLTTLKLPTLPPYAGNAGWDGSPPTGPGSPCPGTTSFSCAIGVCVQAPDGTYSCEGNSTQNTCPDVLPLTPLTGQAAAFEANGNRLSFQSGDPNIDRNLTKLAVEFNKLQVAVFRETQGKVTIQANSAYRPLEYQNHFWEICDRIGKLRNNSNPDCAQLKQNANAERAKHGINASCIVSRPTPCAPHVKGVGIDISAQGITYPAISAIAQREGIDLRWQELSGDRFHFNLINAPYKPPGCP